MVRFFRILFVAFLGVGSLVGCSKKADSSNVHLALPNWPSRESLSKTGADEGRLVAVTENIQVIIINISASDLSEPVYYFWERHDNATATPPASIDLTVPRGINRLTQVMVVFEDKAVGGMEFYYGDAVSSFTADSASVPVTVNALATSSSKEGSVAGRYLRADGTGPTGRVEFRYSPPGKPSMLLTRGFIYSGWFDFFALEGIPFQYIVEKSGGDKEVLFDGVTVNSESLLSGTASARVYMPPYYYHSSYDNQGNPTGSRTSSTGLQSVVGFFGPGASGRATCYDTTVLNLDGSYTSASTTNSTFVQWGGVVTTASGKAGVLEGGVALASCPDVGNIYKNHLRIDSGRVTRREQLLGFTGPFQLQDSAWSGSDRIVVVATPTGTGASFTVGFGWKYLPDVFNEDGIGGVTVFTRSGTLSSNNRPDYEIGEGIACDKLADLGFTKIQDVPATATSASFTLPAGTVTEANYNAGKFQAIFCPYLRTVPSGGNKYPAEGGVDFRAYSWMAPSTSTPSPATHLTAFKAEGSRAITSSSSRAQVMQNVCYPVRVEATTSNGQMGTMSGSATVQVTSPSGGELLYTSSDCVSGGAETLSLTGFTGIRMIYLKNTSASGTAELSLSSSGGVTLASSTFYTQYLAEQAANKLGVFAPTSVQAFSCFSVSYRSLYNGIPARFSSAITFLFPSATGWQFFPDMGSCESGSPQTAFTLDARVEQYAAARYIGTGTGAMSLSPTTSDGGWAGTGATIEAKTINVLHPGTATRLAVLDLPSSLVAETCNPVRVQLQDASSQPVPVRDPLFASPTGGSDSMGVTLTATNAQLFSSGSCSSGASSTMNVSITELSSMSNTVYVRPTAPSSMSLAADVSPGVLTSGVTIAQGTKTMTVSAAVANQVAIGLHGQSWNNGTKMFDGSPYDLLVGDSAPVELHALTSGNNVDASFNKTLSQIGLTAANLSSAAILSGTLSWGSGVASVPLLAQSHFSGAWLELGSGSTGLLYTATPTFNIHAPERLRLLAESTFSRDACQPILVQVTSNGSASTPSVPVLSSTNVTLTYSASSGGSLQFYSSRPCSSGGQTSATVAINSNESQKIVYVKTNSYSDTYTISAAASGFAGGNVGVIATPTSVSAATNLRVVGNANGFRRGVCQGFVVSRTDTNFNAVDVASTLSVGLSSDVAGSFYTDSRCLSGTASVDIPANESDAAFYFRVENPGGTSATATISAAANGLTTGTFSATAE